MIILEGPLGTREIPENVPYRRLPGEIRVKDKLRYERRYKMCSKCKQRGVYESW